MRKILCVLLAMGLMFGALGVLPFGSIQASAAGEYEFDTATGTITKYIGAGGAVDIPGQIDGVTVTKIADRAFLGKSAVTGVTIPNSVGSIGEFAFYQLSNLTSVNIGNGVQTIGLQAFGECRKLSSVTLGSGLKTIGTSAFSNCFALVDIALPNSVETIGDKAFYNCNKLENITLGNGVKTIGVESFSKCASLTDISIPAATTSIGSGALTGCAAMTAIEVDAANPNYKSIDGVLFNKAQTTLLKYPGGKGGNYAVPNGVTALGDYAFFECKSLTGVELPSGLTTLGVGVFQSATALTQIALPSGITVISATAFAGCTALNKVSIPASVTEIKNDAFSGCTALGSITLPPNLITIGEAAFYSTDLEYISFPATLKTIVKEAFLYCRKLKGAYFHGNAPTLGTDVFRDTATGFTVYYKSGTTGFTPGTWKTYPSAVFQAISGITISVQGELKQTHGETTAVTFTAAHTPEVANPATIEWYVNDVRQAVVGKVFVYTPTDPGFYTVSAKVSDNPSVMATGAVIEVEATLLPPIIGKNDIANILLGFDAETMEYAVSVDGGLTYGSYTSQYPIRFDGNKTVKVRLKGNGVYHPSSATIVVFTVDHGDVNSDGVMDITDIIMMAEMAVGRGGYSLAQVARANVKSKLDSAVSVADVVLMLERVSGSYALFPAEISYGDTNGDGEITVVDLIMAAEIAAGYGNYTVEQIARSNVSGSADLLVDISDVVMIAERIMGRNALFAVEME